MITGIRRSRARADNMFLYHRNFFRAHFHTQIAARHHHAVRHLQNLVEIFNRLRLLKLRNHRRILSRARNRRFCRSHIRGAAHKADRHIVDPQPQRKSQILAVFGRKRGYFQLHARQIDPCVLAQFAAVFHLADHVAPANRFHAHRDFSVREQDAITLVNFPRQLLEDCVHAFRGAHHLVGGNHEFLARVQENFFAAFQLSRADFRALQIGQDAHGLLVFHRGLPDCFDPVGVFLVRAVRKIQPRHIHARAYQVAHCRRGRSSRSNRANNFCSAECFLLSIHFGCFPGFRGLTAIQFTVARDTAHHNGVNNITSGSLL